MDKIRWKGMPRQTGGERERVRRDLVERESICDSSFTLSISTEKREKAKKERRNVKRKKI